MRQQTLWTPKRGHQPDEYEDAFNVDPVSGRFAIADGASESSFAGSWAKLLVDAHVQSPVRAPEGWWDWLPPLQQRWSDDVSGRSLPWYAEAKLAQGAFATFLGLTLEPIGHRRWWAVAVGDSCLFHLRANRVLTAFPVAQSTEFGNEPVLLGSRTPVDVVTAERERRAIGEWRPGDRFFLATDALAQWFLKEAEEAGRPWETLAAACEGPVDVFAAWIDTLRDARDIRNDDVTLVVIDV